MMIQALLSDHLLWAQGMARVEFRLTQCRSCRSTDVPQLMQDQLSPEPLFCLADITWGVWVYSAKRDPRSLDTVVAKVVSQHRHDWSSAQ